MTNDELKAAWAVDITSLEKYNEVWRATRNWLPRAALHSNHTHMLPQADHSNVVGLTHGVQDIWPLQRDITREAVGYYPEPTSVLKWLRTMQSNTGAGQNFPHISPQDRMQIAFTPDGHQAKLDRKQRMTIGRYLRKVLLFVPDAEIQRLEQQHRSELDTEFLLAETVDAIRRVYEGMDGDSGCMRYNMDHFNHDEYHPSAVYCSPGMGVAYTEDADGTVKSRSVIWVNPNDASDKRYVRIYGDPILKKKLEANGFKMRGLVGAKLRIYHDPSFDSRSTVVMPWIDPAGGIHAQNADRSYDSEYVVRFKGDEFITMVSSDQKLRYERAGIYLPNVQTQSGHVDVPEVDDTQFVFTCPLSGMRTNRMEVETQLWIDENGAILRVRSQAITDHTERLTSLQVMHEGRMQRAYCKQDVRDKFAIPGHGTHYNDEATRDAVGVCMLDKAFYSESERWSARSLCVIINDALGNATYIKKEDALILYTEVSDKFIHIEMVKPLKKEGCVPVAVLNGYRGLAHKDHPRLAVTRGGKRVITTRHDVVMLHDRSWEYSRNVTSVSVAGVTLHMHKDDAKSTLTVSKAHVAEQYKATFSMRNSSGDLDHNLRRRESRMVTLMSRGFQGSSAYMKKDEAIVTVDYYNKCTTIQPLIEAAKGILLMQEDAEWMRRVLGYQSGNALPWARTIVQIEECMKEFDHEYEMQMAEANAVEAPLAVQQLVQQVNRLGDTGIDSLVSEVDEALATAVVRRWPRLNAVQPPEMRTVQNADGTLSPVPTDLIPMEVGQVDRFVIHAEPTNADDQLLSQLQSVGLAPIVIDENTIFPDSQIVTVSQE